jgi:hypothetical protein
MHDWPAFWQRDATAAAAAASRSASANTTNASLPPSSSTHGLSASPAWAATMRPARVLPVSVTPRTHGCAINSEACRSSRKRLMNAPSANPASWNSAVRASAHCGVLGACFRSTVLPASSAGAAKRTTCQNGKFQGINASSGPSGSKRTPTLRPSPSRGSNASSLGPSSAAQRHPTAHFLASASPSDTGLPISCAAIRANATASRSNRSARRRTRGALSAGSALRLVRNASAETASACFTSSAVAVGCGGSISPVLGSTLW